MALFAAMGTAKAHDVLHCGRRSYVAAVFWTLRDHRRQRAFNRWLVRVMARGN